MTLKTLDCPDANGRQPVAGDQKYTVSMILESGERLNIEMGQHGYEHMGQQLLDMMANAPEYNDGSLDKPYDNSKSPKSP